MLFCKILRTCAFFCVLFIFLSVLGCARHLGQEPFVEDPMIDSDPEVSQLAECLMLLSTDFNLRQGSLQPAIAEVYSSPAFMRTYDPILSMQEDFIVLALATIMTSRGVNQNMAMDILNKAIDKEKARFEKKVKYISFLRGYSRVGSLNRMIDHKLQLCDNLYYKTILRARSKRGE